MLEDRMLVLKCKRGSRDAMCRIYKKYKDHLLTLANALLNDRAAAEDVVHDAFLSFAQSMEKFRFLGSLKAYLATCVSNLARDRMRLKKNQTENLNSVGPIISGSHNPEQQIIEKEELTRLRQAISQLQYQQREVIVLHLKAGLKFREIAKLLDLSINTIQGRYRYGLNKLRSFLNNEVKK